LLAIFYRGNCVIFFSSRIFCGYRKQQQQAAAAEKERKVHSSYKRKVRQSTRDFSLQRIITQKSNWEMKENR